MQVGRAHVKYDNPASSSSGLKVMTKIKVFKRGSNFKVKVIPSKIITRC